MCECGARSFSHSGVLAASQCMCRARKQRGALVEHFLALKHVCRSAVAVILCMFLALVVEFVPVLLFRFLVMVYVLSPMLSQWL